MDHFITILHCIGKECTYCEHQKLVIDVWSKGVLPGNHRTSFYQQFHVSSWFWTIFWLLNSKPFAKPAFWLADHQNLWRNLIVTPSITRILSQSIWMLFKTWWRPNLCLALHANVASLFWRQNIQVSEHPRQYLKKTYLLLCLVCTKAWFLGSSLTRICADILRLELEILSFYSLVIKFKMTEGSGSSGFKARSASLQPTYPANSYVNRYGKQKLKKQVPWLPSSGSFELDWWAWSEDKSKSSLVAFPTLSPPASNSVFSASICSPTSIEFNRAGKRR